MPGSRHAGRAGRAGDGYRSVVRSRRRERSVSDARDRDATVECCAVGARGWASTSDVRGGAAARTDPRLALARPARGDRSRGRGARDACRVEAFEAPALDAVVVGVIA